MRRSVVCLLSFLAVFFVLSAAQLAAQTVTEDNLLSLINKNKAPEALVIQIIGMAKKVEVDTSVENLGTLGAKGVSPKVLAALVERKAQLSPSQPPLAAQTGSADRAEPSASVHTETGVYVQTGTGLVQLKAEPVKLKGTSPLHMMATGGFGAIKTQGVVSGPKSPVQLGGVKVVVVTLSGVNPDDLKLFPLEAKKNQREFTSSKMSFFRGQSMDPDAKEGKFEKTGANDYKASLELPAGEYGFLVASSGNQKIYTFGVY